MHPIRLFRYTQSSHPRPSACGTDLLPLSTTVFAHDPPYPISIYSSPSTQLELVLSPSRLQIRLFHWDASSTRVLLLEDMSRQEARGSMGHGGESPGPRMAYRPVGGPRRIAVAHPETPFVVDFYDAKEASQMRDWAGGVGCIKGMDGPRGAVDPGVGGPGVGGPETVDPRTNKAEAERMEEMRKFIYWLRRMGSGV